MPRTVLLRHELPDGSWHFDWLLAREGDKDGVGAGPAITFRVMEPIQDEGIAAFSAVRLPDHREMYLTYEGEVSGGRGQVHRIATGRCRIDRETDNLLEGAVDWGAGDRWFTAARTDDGWAVRVLATDRR